jgi:hypothetical protein
MSKRNNVNPAHYKVAGRERMGENLTQDRDKQALGNSRSQLGATRRKNRAGQTEGLSADGHTGRRV